MNEFITIFSTFAAAGWSALILLLIYARKKGAVFSRKEKAGAVGIFLFLAGFIGYIYFFNETEVVFKCQKQTMRCAYYIATLSDRQLRLAKLYDLTGINAVEIKTHKRQDGRYTTKTVYRIRFSGKDGGFEMPKDFDFREAAQEQAARAVSFLQTDASDFTYTQKDGDPEGMLVIFSLMLSAAFAFAGCLFLLDKKLLNNRLLT
ncbi:MAG: hypothetical protein IJ752_00120 [Alphaproteobacteria bacterium]|nr:hypothetical protein [Alphaproteobacteria bacterium]